MVRVVGERAAAGAVAHRPSRALGGVERVTGAGWGCEGSARAGLGPGGSSALCCGPRCYADDR